MKNKPGQAAIISVLFFLTIGIIIGTGLASIAYRQTKSAETFIDSIQSYFTAESGVEDAFLRLKQGWGTPSSYVVTLSSSKATINVNSLIDGSLLVYSEGNSKNSIRRVEAVYELSNDFPGFFFGAQVGAGGLFMRGNSRINGNIFSNGPISMAGLTRITDSVVISGIDGIITGAWGTWVDGDLYSPNCTNMNIAGTLHSTNINNCNASSVTASGIPIDTMPMPISQEKINQWKNDAESGGTIGAYTLDNNNIGMLGPIKINGNLVIENNAELIVTGTIWVTGNITLSDSGRLILDSSYGNTSGVVIANGVINLQNDTRSRGSGNPGSYLMYISTNNANPAINIANSAEVDIVYTSNGWINIQGNTKKRAVMGYGINLANSSSITYEIGLQHTSFFSGPQAGWSISTWKEVP